MTNTESFCISCREMEAALYEELKKTVHCSNPDVHGWRLIGAGHDFRIRVQFQTAAKRRFVDVF